MTDTNFHPVPVLAVAPVSQGLGYAVFEGPTRLVDWGIKRVRTDKNRRAVVQTAALVQLYRPRVLVLEDYAGPGSRRRKRIRALIDQLGEVGRQKRIRTRRYSRGEIAAYFDGPGRVTKEAIARELAQLFPELQPFLPPKRRPWMAEDARMGIFDAIALAITCFADEATRRQR